RDLLRLPEKAGAACVEFIFGPLVENPYRLGGMLRGPLEGLRSARRGSYRIMYRIEDAARTIENPYRPSQQRVPMIGVSFIDGDALRHQISSSLNHHRL